jgi:hypothetical protein
MKDMLLDVNRPHIFIVQGITAYKTVIYVIDEIHIWLHIFYFLVITYNL